MFQLYRASNIKTRKRKSPPIYGIKLCGCLIAGLAGMSWKCPIIPVHLREGSSRAEEAVVCRLNDGWSQWKVGALWSLRNHSCCAMSGLRVVMLARLQCNELLKT